MLESALHRDRLVVVTGLFVLTVLAWAYLVWLAEGMRMPATGTVVATRAWSPLEFVLMFVMWSVMMVAMMTPSAAPMILIHARVGRQAALQGKSLAATGVFAGGYLLAWMTFSLAAALTQWGLHEGLLLTPMMASTSAVFSGMLLIAAGAYQWTPAKQACLRHCQAPIASILQHGGFRRKPRASLVAGFRQGLYCIGCCWALMALLFVGGVMNLVWIAVISILVLAEKVIPAGGWLPRITGAMLGSAGLVLLSAAMLRILPA